MTESGGADDNELLPVECAAPFAMAKAPVDPLRFVWEESRSCSD